MKEGRLQAVYGRLHDPPERIFFVRGHDHTIQLESRTYEIPLDRTEIEISLHSGRWYKGSIRYTWDDEWDSTHYDAREFSFKLRAVYADPDNRNFFLADIRSRLGEPSAKPVTVILPDGVLEFFRQDKTITDRPSNDYFYVYCSSGYFSPRRSVSTAIRSVFR